MLNLVFYTAKNSISRFKHNGVMYVTEDYIGLSMSLLSYYKHRKDYDPEEIKDEFYELEIRIK